jgi:hypothetical protein
MIAALVVAIPMAIFVAIRFRRLNQPSFLDQCVPYEEGVIPPQGWVLVEIQGQGRYWVNPTLLKSGSPQTELTPEQVERIRAFKEILGSNDPSSLEEALANFSRDHDPEPEIAVWEHIARVWQREVAERGASDPAHATLLYVAVLGCSLVGPSAEALLAWNPGLKGISDLEGLAARYRGAE